MIPSSTPLSSVQCSRWSFRCFAYPSWHAELVGSLHIQQLGVGALGKQVVAQDAVAVVADALSRLAQRVDLRALEDRVWLERPVSRQLHHHSQVLLERAPARCEALLQVGDEDVVVARQLREQRPCSRGGQHHPLAPT